MKPNNKVFCLFLTVAAILFTPYLGLYIRHTGIPDGFFHFPALHAEQKPPNNWLIITLASGLFLAFLLLMFFPRIYGFRKNPPEAVTIVKKSVKFPIWSWIGLTMWIVILFVFVFRISCPKWLLDWALLPLWWGFILMLDGVVFVRSEGKSLVKDSPTELVAMGVLAISGWLIFEYFNFFAGVNWYYPFATRLKHYEFLLYAFVGSSAFIPMCFEWYHLLRTIPTMNRKYKLGPVRRFSTTLKIILIVLSLAGLFLTSYFPDNLFCVMWFAPLIILTVVIEWLGLWTPFTPITKTGDWTALLVFAPTFLIQGVFVECWNYLSAVHVNGVTVNSFNPGFWSYCVPYVSFGHIFEMPVVGYLGYVPFSIYSFIWFLAMSYLMDINTEFSFHHEVR